MSSSASATWCGPCQLEMPLLEKDIWQKYKSSPDFAMVAIAREQTKDTVVTFEAKHKFTYPLAYDPNRAVYAKFADSGIPRAYVVDRKGRIVYRTVGYDPDHGVGESGCSRQQGTRRKIGKIQTSN